MDVELYTLFRDLNWLYDDLKPHEEIMAYYASIPDKTIVAEGNEVSLVHVAAQHADAEAIEYLLANGAKANAKTTSNETALHFLAEEPYHHCNIRTDEAIFKTASLLLQARVSPLTRDNRGELCYHRAVHGKKCLSFIYAMMEHKVKLDMRTDNGDNVLKLLVRYPAQSAYSRIYSHSSDEEQRAEAKKLYDDCFDLARALIDYGIEPDEKIIEMATEEGLGKFSILLRGEYDESDPMLEDKIASKGKSLHWAAYDGELEAVQALIRLGADVNEISIKYRDFENHTPLSLACAHYHMDCARALVDAGADPNVRGGKDDCAVFYNFARAFRYQNSDDRKLKKAIAELITLLLDAGLDPNRPVDEKGNTPLNLLCTRFGGDRRNVIREELLEAGVGDYNLPDLEGRTPLMNLVQEEPRYNENHLITLLEFGADMTLKDNKSNTALMYAARNSSRNIALSASELLFSFGDPLPAAVNNEGLTALDYAVKQNNELLVKLLLSKM